MSAPAVAEISGDNSPPSVTRRGVTVPEVSAPAPKPQGNILIQQRLRSWQPSLSARGVFWCYSIIGVLFIAVGIILYAVNNTAHEITKEYSIPTGTVDNLHIYIDEDMPSPVYLYYELENFYQNHRRYVKSREDRQLLGDEIFTSKSSLSNCDPMVSSSVDSSLVLYPCGLVAKSVFTDKFTFFRQPDSVEELAEKISVNSESSRISWDSDVEHKFRNIDVATNKEKMDMWIYSVFPVEVCEPKTLSAAKERVTVAADLTNAAKMAKCDFQAKTCEFEKQGVAFDCNGDDWEKVKASEAGVESGHFINWMRTAGLPKFRKLYGVMETGRLKKGDTLTVRIQSDFEVAAFGGKKKIVVATVSALGGQNYFLAIGYLVVGSLSLMFAFVFTVRHRLGSKKNIKHLD